MKIERVEIKYGEICGIESGYASQQTAFTISGFNCEPEEILDEDGFYYAYTFDLGGSGDTPEEVSDKIQSKIDSVCSKFSSCDFLCLLLKDGGIFKENTKNTGYYGYQSIGFIGIKTK